MGQWDVVIDTCGYHPAAVSASARALSGSVDRYVFISTISVYPWPVPPNTAENAALTPLPHGADQNEEVPETYGARKALCEAAVTAAFADSHLIVRPGMIVGPHDETDWFTHWVKKASKGGKIIAPGAPDRRLQLIDVEDIADFILRLAGLQMTGIFNVTGPIAPLTWSTFLSECLKGTDAVGELVWVNDETLIARGFSPCDAAVPWWIPAKDNGLFEIDTRRAIENGLMCRPLEETVRRTWEWLNAQTSFSPPAEA